MKSGFILFIVVCAAAIAQDAPSLMTRMTVKVESPEIPKDSFAAQAKRMYRAGSRYCRIEENPDPANGIWGLVIINEPDVWMVNRLDKTARHMVDPGPTYNCRMPIFVGGEEIRSAQDMRRPLMDLEFGREFEFFKPRSGPPQPGPMLRDKTTVVYTAPLPGMELFLFTSGDPEVPVAVIRKTEKGHEMVWYGEYAQVPFDASLFEKPGGVKIEEPK